MPSPIFVTLTRNDEDIEGIVNAWQKEGHGVKIDKIRKAIRLLYQMEQAAAKAQTEAQRQKLVEPQQAPEEWPRADSLPSVNDGPAGE
jgi:hypothetical protein